MASPKICINTAFVIVALGLSGCAFERGSPFAKLMASLEPRFATPADRDVGNGWQKLSSEYQIRLSVAQFELTSIELKDFGESGSASNFDPAKPPPGYTLCHGGHCHRNDGALISYEEISADLAGRGGAGGGTTVVTLPVGLIELLMSSKRPLSCEPSCELPLSHITQARLSVARVTLQGTVRDGRSPPRVAETPWRVNAAFATPGADAGTPASLIFGKLEMSVGRHDPPRAVLELKFQPTAILLDLVDWSSLQVAAGQIDISTAANASGLEAIRSQLAEIPLTAEVSRGS